MRYASRLSILLALAMGLPALYGQPVRFRTQVLPRAVVGTEYRAEVSTIVNGRCPASDVSLAVVEGQLPEGLEIQGGVISGIAADTGSYHITLRAANTCAAATHDFDLLVTGKPILKAVPEMLVFECHAGGAAPAPQSVLVSSTWPNLPYSVSRGATQWVNPQQTRGMTPPAGSALTSDLVAVQVDPHNLVPGIYRSPLVLSTWQGANQPVVQVTIRVLP